MCNYVTKCAGVCRYVQYHMAGHMADCAGMCVRGKDRPARTTGPSRWEVLAKALCRARRARGQVPAYDVGTA